MCYCRKCGQFRLGDRTDRIADVHDGQSYPIRAAGCHSFCAATQMPSRLAFGAHIKNMYSFAIMVSSSGRQLWPRAQAAVLSLRGFVRGQFITRNRRMAAVLAVAVVGIGIGAVHVETSWFSPGLMILPILAGGLFLWPR